MESIFSSLCGMDCLPEDTVERQTWSRTLNGGGFRFVSFGQLEQDEIEGQPISADRPVHRDVSLECENPREAATGPRLSSEDWSL